MSEPSVSEPSTTDRNIGTWLRDNFVTRSVYEGAAAQNLRPMRLSRRAEPFDSNDFICELKIDGFRSLAYIAGPRRMKFVTGVEILGSFQTQWHFERPMLLRQPTGGW